MLAKVFIIPLILHTPLHDKLQMKFSFRFSLLCLQTMEWNIEQFKNCLFWQDRRRTLKYYHHSIIIPIFRRITHRKIMLWKLGTLCMPCTHVSMYKKNHNKSYHLKLLRANFLSLRYMSIVHHRNLNMFQWKLFRGSNVN